MIPRKHLLIVFFILLADSLFAAILYPNLPPQVPIHWNWRGQIDAYGPPWTAAAILPICNWLLMLLFFLLPRVNKRFRANFSSFSHTYARVVVTIAFSLFAIHIAVLFKAMGRFFPIERVLYVIVGLMIAILGNWLGKIRRDAYLGVRTPWTLANDNVWERTNRLGGRIMVIFGLILALTALFAPPRITFAYLVGGAALIILWALLYSHRIYHDGSSLTH